MALKSSISQAAYDKENCRRVVVRVNREKEADIISWLENKPSMQGYIKALIAADLEKEAADNGK